MLEVQPDLVTVLADTIERSEDLYKDHAEAAKKQAEALAHKGDLSPEARARAIEQLTEAVARLHIDRRTPETALTPPKTRHARSSARLGDGSGRHH